MNAVAISPIILDDEQYDRRQYLGGSDIGGILNISPWSSPVQVWNKKLQPERPPDRGKRKLFKRGKRWEGVVAEMLTEDLEAKGHKVVIVASNNRYQDAVVPNFAAEIDFEVILDDEPDITNVELKTVHPFATNKWGETGSDDMPVWYTAQCMWGLGVAPGQRKRSILAALFGADELRTYPVMREQPVIEAMRTHAGVFWNQYVLTKKAPPPVNIADVALLFPDQLRPYVLATPEIQEDYLQLKGLAADTKANEAKAEVLKFRVMKFMRDAGGLLLPGRGDKPAITWMPRAQSTFDFEGLKEDQPATYKRYRISGTARPFIVKP